MVRDNAFRAPCSRESMLTSDKKAEFSEAHCETTKSGIFSFNLVYGCIQSPYHSQQPVYNLHTYPFQFPVHFHREAFVFPPPPLFLRPSPVSLRHRPFYRPIVEWFRVQVHRFLVNIQIIIQFLFSSTTSRPYRVCSWSFPWASLLSSWS
jgi:hypothetical protein